MVPLWRAVYQVLPATSQLHTCPSLLWHPGAWSLQTTFPRLPRQLAPRYGLPGEGPGRSSEGQMEDEAVLPLLFPPLLRAGSLQVSTFPQWSRLQPRLPLFGRPRTSKAGLLWSGGHLHVVETAAQGAPPRQLRHWLSGGPRSAAVTMLPGALERASFPQVYGW